MVIALAQTAKKAARILATVSTHTKNQALLAAARQLRDQTAVLLAANAQDCQDCIQENAAVIRQRFSLTAAGRRLADVYQQIMASANDTPLEPLSAPGKILDSFLHLRRLHPVRLESCHPTSLSSGG